MSAALAVMLDLTGLSCPLPIVKTAKAMKDMAPGDLVEVVATDPGSVQDFAAWCTSTGNELVTSAQEDGKFHYVIRKR